MHPSSIIVLIASTIFLLAGTTFAVPADTNIALPPEVEPVQILSQPSDPQRPWTRFRDWAVRTIWGIPQSPSHQISLKDPSRDRTPPSKFLARYGSDVVLRFYLRDAVEAEALAEAADILFLDVWASTSEFVDIRLAREVVS